MLYVWFMTLLRLIGSFRRHGFYFGHSVAMSYTFRPSLYVDVALWITFLSSIEEPFSILMYSGYSSFLSFITHASDFDFVPLVGLRGVTTCHPLVVTRQFDQLQEFHSFNDAFDYRFPILSSIEDDLARAYDFWAHKVLANFRDSHPGQTSEYSAWLKADLEADIVDYAKSKDDSFDEDLWRISRVIRRSRPRMICLWD